MNHAARLKAVDSATSQLQGRAVPVHQAPVLRNYGVGAYLIDFDHKDNDGLLPPASGGSSASRQRRS